MLGPGPAQQAQDQGPVPVQQYLDQGPGLLTPKDHKSQGHVRFPGRNPVQDRHLYIAKDLGPQELLDHDLLQGRGVDPDQIVVIKIFSLIFGNQISVIITPLQQYDLQYN